jgi:hypothetical protein
MAQGCFTDVMLCISISYHQEHALSTATEPRWLCKYNQAAYGTVILRFHRVSNLWQVLICGPNVRIIMKRKFMDTH